MTCAGEFRGGEKYESDIFGVVAVNRQCVSWLEIKKGERCFLHVSSRLAFLCNLLESLSRDEVAPPTSTGGMDAAPPTCAKQSMEVRSHFSNLHPQIHLDFIPDGATVKSIENILDKKNNIYFLPKETIMIHTLI